MARVALALARHEVLERARDRWVLLVSLLFAALAVGTSLYGRSAGEAASALTGPSLVTLISLLVPLVGCVLGHDAIVGERERNTLGLLLSLPVARGEVVAAKFVGRFVALAGAIGIGLGAAALVGGEAQASTLLSLLGPTLLLGGAFLSLGVLLSAVTARQVTAASLTVALWFGLVFFYDLALLALLVATDGAVSQEAVAQLVYANPAGLFRVQMMASLAGPEVMEGLGMTVGLPPVWASAGIWAAWIALPVALSAWLLSRSRSLR